MFVMRDLIKKYANRFSEFQLWSKLGHYAREAGIRTVYMVLLLYYAYQRKETPAWAKNIVLGTLGYFLAPLDAIPDLSPVIGYTDDVGVLSFGLVAIAAHIDHQVRSNAKTKLAGWFGQLDHALLVDIDEKL